MIDINSLNFIYPFYLYFIPLALFLPVVAFILKKKELLNSSMISVIFKSVAISLLLAAIAFPYTEKEETSDSLSLLLDTSGSMTEKSYESLSQVLEDYSNSLEGLSLAVYPFSKDLASEPVMVSSNYREKIFEILENSSKEKSTNIEQALRTYTGEGNTGSVLVFSDGEETDGDSNEFLNTTNNLSIFPIVTNGSNYTKDEVIISQVNLPLVTKAKDITPFSVTLSNKSQIDKNTTLVVLFDDKPLYEKSHQIKANDQELIKLKTPSLTGGLHKITTFIKSGDVNTYKITKWITAKEKQKLLLLSGDRDDEVIIKKLIQLQGYALESYRAVNKIPTDLSKYSGIIVNNIFKKDLPRGFLKNLQSYVSGGGGALLMGGGKSFGLGGYRNTPLEEISPVKFLPPTVTKKRLNNAIVLVIDKSRSMAFGNKIESAKRAALSSVESLKDEDYISVIGFDTTPFVIISMDKVADAKIAARRRLRNLTASGRTNLLPALNTAQKTLMGTKAGKKHIIVLSDGKLPDAGGQYRTLIKKMRKEGITLSTVALGVEADGPFMETLSRTGGGAFYHTLDPSKLPQIFIQDIRVTTSSNSSLEEQKEFEVYEGPSGLISTPLANYPYLLGFVKTLPKKTTKIELITKTKGQSFPILASHNYKKGKVIVYTSDISGRWSLPWLKWRGFPSFWDSLIDSIKDKSKEKSDVDFDLKKQIKSRSITLDLALYDQKLKPSTKIKSVIKTPKGTEKVIDFDQIELGRYQHKIENASEGDYELKIEYGETKLPTTKINVSAHELGEVKGAGLNLRNLENLAIKSGGSINPSAQELVTKRTTNKTREDYFFVFALAALIFLFLDFFFDARKDS